MLRLGKFIVNAFVFFAFSCAFSAVYSMTSDAQLAKTYLDLNDDGFKEELILIRNSPQTLQVQFKIGESLETILEPTSYDELFSIPNNSQISSAEILAKDINGDRKTDIIIYAKMTDAALPHYALVYKKISTLGFEYVGKFSGWIEKRSWGKSSQLLSPVVHGANDLMSTGAQVIITRQRDGTLGGVYQRRAASRIDKEPLKIESVKLKKSGKDLESLRLSFENPLVGSPSYLEVNLANQDALGSFVGRMYFMRGNGSHYSTGLSSAMKTQVSPDILQFIGRHYAGS